MIQLGFHSNKYVICNDVMTTLKKVLLGALETIFSKEFSLISSKTEFHNKENIAFLKDVNSSFVHHIKRYSFQILCIWQMNAEKY